MPFKSGKSMKSFVQKNKGVIKNGLIDFFHIKSTQESIHRKKFSADQLLEMGYESGCISVYLKLYGDLESIKKILEPNLDVIEIMFAGSGSDICHMDSYLLSQIEDLLAVSDFFEDIMLEAQKVNNMELVNYLSNRYQ